MQNVRTLPVGEGNEEITLALDELAREGARRMIAAALRAEADEYVERFSDELDGDGHREVVRNGRARERRVTVGSGTIPVRAPRVNDKRVDEEGERQKFSSRILPAYSRRSPKVGEVIPILYLRGLSTGDFRPALEGLLGEDAAGLSASTVSRLCKEWEAHHDRFRQRLLSFSRYAYLFMDGIHVRVRLGEDPKVCLLIVIGVREDGVKELLAVEDGYRESTESWAGVFRDLKRRGLNEPRLVVGDGALGAWAALRDVFPGAGEQRCWFHAAGNVIDALPKRLQSRAKGLLGEVIEAPTRGLSDEVCVVGVTDLACVSGQDWREAVGVAAILARARPGKDPIIMQEMTDKPTGWRGCPGHAHEGAEAREELQDRLAGLLPADALQDALKGLGPEGITGQGGLLTQLAGRVIDAALAGELSDHLGYPPGQAPPGGAGNHRNGSIGKTVATDLGPVAVNTPRDRQGTFQPKLVGKRQTRLAGLDEKILSLYAGGMSVRDISEHLSSLYGTEIGRDTISRVTDAVLQDIAAWRSRPLETLYPIVYFDALMVKMTEDRSVKTRACYLAVGVTLEGDREILGLWWQDTEGAKFWLAVLNDLHQRGVGDVLIACVDGLTGFPEAIAAVFPQAWVQTCIVHMIRASMRYVSYTDRKKLMPDLRRVYSAPNVEEAARQLELFDEKWGERYPMVAQAWRDRWEHVIPFLSLPADLRRVVYTTNAIEGLNRQVRKAIKTRGHFPDEQAATKLIYLALMRAETKWVKVMRWPSALRALKIHFGDRIPY